MMQNRLLLPQHNIYLETADCADPQRFIRVFRETWSHIPPVAQEDLLRRWSMQDALRRDEQSKISLELWDGTETSPVIKVIRDRWPEGTVGEFFPGKLIDEIQYNAVAVDMLPDDLLPVLISHELVHVFMYAQDDYQRPRYPDEREFEEWLTRDTNDMWGFDEEALTSWLASNPIEP